MIKLKYFLKGFRKGMQDFGQTISIIFNSLILTIIYLVGVGLTSLLAKIFKKKFLETKLSKKQDSYWSDINLNNRKIEDYYKQF